MCLPQIRGNIVTPRETTMRKHKDYMLLIILNHEICKVKFKKFTQTKLVSFVSL